MKLKSLFFLAFVFIIISCHREPEPPEPIRYSIELIYPSENTVIETDTFSVIIKANSSDTTTFSKVSIMGGVVYPFQKQTYKRLLNRSMFSSPRMSIPISFLNEENAVFTDSIRLIYFNLNFLDAYQMTKPRANHASAVISDHQIISSGGSSVYDSQADDTYEIFDSNSGASEIKPEYKMKFSRAGHGMIYDSLNQRIHVFGGGNFQYANESDGVKIPTERFQIGQTSLQSENEILTQDFAYYFDGEKLYVHGGVEKENFTTMFASYLIDDSLTNNFLNTKSFGAGEHVLVQDPIFSSTLLFQGNTFGLNFPPYSFGFIYKIYSGIVPENVNLHEARNEHCAVNLENGFILFSGGFSIQNGEVKILDSFELLDASTLKVYQVGTKFQSERASHTMCKLGNNIFIFGGYNQNKTVLNSVEKFTYHF